MFNWIKNRFRRGPTVPVVRLTGVIAAGGVLGQRGLSIETAAPLLAKAFGTRGAKAVALSINSPGGSPVQSALIAQRIRLLAEEKSLPVIAFVEDVAASGGYWLACAADEIVADPASIVGSIGVVSSGFGFHELIARYGIERRGTHLKGGDSLLFTGEFWTGRRGLELGLVDSLGELRATLQKRFGDKVRLPVITTRRRFLARFGLGSRLGSGIDQIGASTLAAIEERAHWQRFGL